MIHPIYRVVSFAIVAPYTLRVTFDDTTTQVIDFSPILEGELYRPLRDVALFNQVHQGVRARSNPYEAPGCQETDDSSERILCEFFSAALVLASSVSDNVCWRDCSG